MLSKSYSGGMPTDFDGSYRPDAYNLLDPHANNGAVKLEILEAADLPDEVNPFCYAWLFVKNDELDGVYGSGFSINTIESCLFSIENSPQVQTCTLHSKIDPVWKESFTLTEAIHSSADATRKILVPLASRSVTVVISVHNTVGDFGMEELVGCTYIKDLRPGDVVNQWCLLYRSDQQQVLGRTGKPTAVHLKMEYLKQAHTLAWTEASSAESNLSQAVTNPLASAQLRPDYAQMLSSSLSSFSKRGPLVVSLPKRQTQIPNLSEPPIDLLLHSTEAAALHQHNLALSKEHLRKNSLVPLLPFIYENQEWYVMEGITSGDKVIEIGPRRTNKPVAIRYCKGDSSQIVINLQGVTEMIYIEHCSNLRLMVSLVSKNVIISGCRDVEIIVGRIAPSVLFLACKQCAVLVCKETWRSLMQCIGCVGIFIHAAHSNGLMDLEPNSLLTASVMERILLPDILLTQIKLGTITTQCHFSEELASADPSCELSRQIDLPGPVSNHSYLDLRSSRPFARNDFERLRSAQALYTSQMIPDRHGVGMLLRKHENGFKIEKVAVGGPAWKDGMIQEGDILVGIQGAKTSGKSTLEVGEQLSGPAFSKVVLSLNRYNSITGAMNVFDVTLQLGPVDNDIGFSDGDVMISNSKSNVISPSLSDSFVNRDASIRSHCRDLQPDTMSSESSALASTPAVIKDPKAVVGVGLGVRPNADGSYSVSGIIPYSSAELCEKIQVGDIVHSVDGVPVCGKPYETVRDLVQGPYGTQGLSDVGSWRSVILTRGLSASSPFVASILNQPDSSKSISIKPEITQTQSNTHTAATREAFAVALWLNEDYETIASNGEQKALFSSQLAEDLANALQTSSRRIIVVDLLKGPIADINLMPDYLEEYRSPENLAKEIADMASDPTSRLRIARTTFRAIRAEIRGPVSKVRPLREDFSLETAKSQKLVDRERATSAPTLQFEAEVREREEAERSLLEEENLERLRLGEEQERLLRQKEEDERTRQTALDQDLMRKQSEELRHLRRQNEDLEMLRKKTEEWEILMRFAEEQERLKNMAEERLLQKLSEERDHQQRDTYEKDRLRKAEEAEVARRKQEAVDEDRRRIGEQERLQKLEHEEQIRRRRLDEEEQERRERMDEEEALRRKRMDEEERERRRLVEAEIEQKMHEEENRVKKEMEQQEWKLQEQLEQERLERLMKEEEERARAERESEVQKRREQEAEARQKQFEKENNRQAADSELNAEEERRQNSSTAIFLMPSMISTIYGPDISGDLRSATATPRVPTDIIRRAVLIRAANQGKPVKNGEDVGVGISFQAARNSNHIVVVSVAPGSSAEASGQVFVGDIIHRINDISVQGKRIPAVVSMIKGPPGTSVVMELQSSDAPPPTVMAGSLYSSLHATPSPSNSPQANPAELPGAHVVSLVRQPIGPNAGMAGPGEIVGVGLGFVVTEGAHVVSALAPNGSAERSGQIYIGDGIVSVDGVPTTGKGVDTVVGLIKGRRGTSVRLAILPGGASSGAAAASLTQRPGLMSLRQPGMGPPLRLSFTPSSAGTPVLSVPTSARSRSPPEAARVAGDAGEPHYSLRVTVRSAAGLLGVSPGRVPVAVCHVRLLYPDAPPRECAAMPPVVPSTEPSYGNRVLDVPIAASRMRSVQLELTLWDDHARDQGFMGEVVINVGKLAEPGATLGRAIEHSFAFKAGGTFVPKRQVSGSIVLELLLRPPAR